MLCRRWWGLTGWNCTVFPPHFTVSRVAPGSCFFIRITTVVFIQISEREMSVSLAYQVQTRHTKLVRQTRSIQAVLVVLDMFPDVTKKHKSIGFQKILWDHDTDICLGKWWKYMHWCCVANYEAFDVFGHCAICCNTVSIFSTVPPLSVSILGIYRLQRNDSEALMCAAGGITWPHLRVTNLEYLGRLLEFKLLADSWGPHLRKIAMRKHTVEFHFPKLIGFCS